MRWVIVLVLCGCGVCLLAQRAPGEPDAVRNAEVARDFEETRAVSAAELDVQSVALERRLNRGRSPKASWAVEQVEGPPDVPAAGDNPLAWASLTPDGEPEWLICEYASPVKVRAVAVHESFSPGALVRLTAFSPDGKEVVAWEGKDPTPQGSGRGVSLIPVRLDFAVQRIKLYIDSPAVPGWNEVDAVSLEDADGATHWVVKARASSVYGTGGGGGGGPAPYSTQQATGSPDTFVPGRQPTAWNSSTPDGQREWLSLRFETPQTPTEIVVHETSAPGAVTKIGAFDADGKEVVVWEGTDPTPRSQPWGVSVFPVTLAFPTTRVKLYLDSPAVPGFNEIDAVGLRTGRGQPQWAMSATASSTFGQPVQFVEPTTGMMMSPPNADLDDLADEVKRLKQQVDELKKSRDEIEKLKKLLSEKLK
jgi:hypothetical protein